MGASQLDTVWGADERRSARIVETAFIERGGGRAGGEADQLGPDSPRWSRLLTYRTIWGMTLGFFCLKFGIYFFIIWFPPYLIEARHFDAGLKLGFAGATPELTAVVGAWAGRLFSDRLIRRGVSLTKARKIPMVGGMLCGSVIAIALIVPNAWAALGLLTIGFASLAFVAASVRPLPDDVASSHWHVASIGSIQSFASRLAGVGSPALFGILKGTTESFIPLLVITSAVTVVGAISYGLITGRVGPLPRR
jgi:MFS transporter, ACS family, D-galactonate transporter